MRTAATARSRANRLWNSGTCQRKRECAVKRSLWQPVQVRPEELSVRLGSYPSDEKGDRLVEALEKGARVGGSASVRAATRVKSEQAPKGWMRVPSHLSFGEGRSDGSDQPTLEDPSTRRGSGRSTHASDDERHGRPVVERDVIRDPLFGEARRQESEGPIVLMKPGNVAEGRGPGSGCASTRQGEGDWREPENLVTIPE